MAYTTQDELQGCDTDRVRRLGDLETGLRNRSKRYAYSCGVRLHGALRKGRDSIHLVRAWFIVGGTTISAFAGLAALVFKGH